ncbi:hypothetical protein CUMW_083030 [Citrus unshiu]|nr:hypothetical protein CUMW_083030 [Citrus unshiu]
MEILNLINVFEVFIPQLHLYPNPYSLLNGEAAVSKDYFSSSARLRDQWATYVAKLITAYNRKWIPNTVVT